MHWTIPCGCNGEYAVGRCIGALHDETCAYSRATEKLFHPDSLKRSYEITNIGTGEAWTCFFFLKSIPNAIRSKGVFPENLDECNAGYTRYTLLPGIPVTPCLHSFGSRRWKSNTPFGVRTQSARARHEERDETKKRERDLGKINASRVFKESTKQLTVRVDNSSGGPPR